MCVQREERMRGKGKRGEERGGGNNEKYVTAGVREEVKSV